MALQNGENIVCTLSGLARQEIKKLPEEYGPKAASDFNVCNCFSISWEGNDSKANVSKPLNRGLRYFQHSIRA